MTEHLKGKQISKKLPDFSPHALEQPLVAVLAVADDVEDEVEDEDAVVDPHRDEDDEP